MFNIAHSCIGELVLVAREGAFCPSVHTTRGARLTGREQTGGTMHTPAMKAKGATPPFNLSVSS